MNKATARREFTQYAGSLFDKLWTQLNPNGGSAIATRGRAGNKPGGTRRKGTTTRGRRAAAGKDAAASA